MGAYVDPFMIRFRGQDWALGFKVEGYDFGAQPYPLHFRVAIGAQRIRTRTPVSSRQYLAKSISIVFKV